MREFLHQGYWFLREEPWLVWLAAIFIVVILLIVKGESHARERTAQHKEKFYYECLKDHKEYECDVLWGQANSRKKKKESTMMYVPIGKGSPGLILPM